MSKAKIKNVPIKANILLVSPNNGGNRLPVCLQSLQDFKASRSFMLVIASVLST